MRKAKRTKIFPILLALVMCLSLVPGFAPTAVFAADIQTETPAITPNIERSDSMVATDAAITSNDESQETEEAALAEPEPTTTEPESVVTDGTLVTPPTLALEDNEQTSNALNSPFSTLNSPFSTFLSPLQPEDTGIVPLASDVPYIDASGDAKVCASATDLTSSSTNWYDGWYVVNSNVTISGGIRVSGDVHLILADGFTLTASQGIRVEGVYSLTIYGQDAGTGAVTATAAGAYAAGIGGSSGQSGGTITINGGRVTAEGDDGAGIGGGDRGGGGTITINGGRVTAEGDDGAGIGGGSGGTGGTVTINGGHVSAISYDHAIGATGAAVYVYGGYVMTHGPSSITDIAGTLTMNGNAHIWATNGSISDSNPTLTQGVLFIGSNGTVYGDVTLTPEMLYEFMAVNYLDLTIPSGASLTLPAGLSVTNAGTITNNGTITNSGTIVNRGTITNNGTLSGSKFTPYIGTWPTAAALTYGQALSDSVLTGGTASISGSFTWTDGTIIPTITNSGYSVSFKPADSANHSTLTETVGIMVNPSAETTPTASIDYVNETLTGLVAGTYSFNGGTDVSVTGTTYAIDAAWMDGSALSIVKKGDGTNTTDSVAQSLPIPARPGAPSGLAGVAETAAGQSDGKITGTTTDMEYANSSAPTAWTDCAAGETTGLAPGTYSVRAKAVASTSFASAAATVTNSGTAPTITTTSLPGGAAGTAYSQTLAAMGDTPVAWSIVSGSLPDGLSLSSAGIILGTPTAAGTFNFTVQAANGVLPNATKAFSLTISANSASYAVLKHFDDFTGSGTSSAQVDADNNKFVRLLKGGIEVNAQDYSITPGSTIITFTEAHLKTLPNGTHWYLAEFSDGASENIRLNVNVALAPTPLPTPNNPNPAIPQTGDTLSIDLLLAAAFLSLAGLALVLLALKHRRNDGKA